MPEALAIGLFGPMGRYILVHGCGDTDELVSSVSMIIHEYQVLWLHDRQHGTNDMRK